MLKWRLSGEHVFNLGYIMPRGQVWTDTINWTAKTVNLLDASHAYIEELAVAIGGEVARLPSGVWYVTKSGTAPRLTDFRGKLWIVFLLELSQHCKVVPLVRKWRRFWHDSSLRSELA